MYHYILFDLDGTLTDPKEGITKCVQYALAHFGIHEETDNLTDFIGPPLLDSFMRFYNLSEAEAREAVRLYRERFGPVGIYENRVYPGIPEMLKGLKEKGLVISLATSKPELYARQILERFGLSPYFNNVTGSLFDGKRTDKGEVITEAMRLLGCADPDERCRVLMVGDRMHDAAGALKCGIDCLGADFGYAHPGELEKAGAIAVVPDVAAMTKWLADHCE